MKMKTTGYVFMAYRYDDDYRIKSWIPELWSCKVAENENRVFIEEQQFTVDIPDDFDPIPGQVAALEEKKREALAEYQRTVAEINDRLSKLQAIEFAP